MSLPDRLTPDPRRLERFEQLCHEVCNPLMVISGHAYLLGKAIRRIPQLPTDECEKIIADLDQITLAVASMAAQLDAHRTALSESTDDP